MRRTRLSLGCLLVWLVIGYDPFLVNKEEVASAEQGMLEGIHRKQNSWVSSPTWHELC